MSLDNTENLRLVNFNGLYINPARVKKLYPLVAGGTRVELSSGQTFHTSMCEAEVREHAGIPNHVGTHMDTQVDQILATARAAGLTLRHELAFAIRSEFPTMPISEAIALVKKREALVP